MKQVQTLVIEGDQINALYTEKIGLDVRQMGRITKAEKISDVKFNPKTQRWEAIDRKTKKVVATDKSRTGCVEKEHAYYDRRIAKGKYPWSRKTR